MKYDNKPVVAQDFQKECEENKEFIEKQNFDIRQAKLKNNYYRTSGNTSKVGDELYKLIKTFGT